MIPYSVNSRAAIHPPHLKAACVHKRVHTIRSCARRSVLLLQIMSGVYEYYGYRTASATIHCYNGSYRRVPGRSTRTLKH